MAKSQKRKGQHRQRYEQSVPMVLGRRTASRQAAAQPFVLQPIWVVGGVGGLLLIAMIMWFTFSPRFHVASAQVIGTSRVAQEQVFSASELLQSHVLLANGRAAEARILEQLPSVKEVKVSCFLPADCIISVVEWPALLTWETEDGQFLWVDGAGGTSRASQPLEDRWLIRGELSVDERGLVSREVLVGLAELTRLGVQPGPISYRIDRGLILHDSAGWRVIVGSGTGMAERLQAYATVRVHLLNEGIQPRFVDVRFPDAPYYSETNEW